MTVTLSVQSYGIGKFRLVASKADSENMFKGRGVIVELRVTGNLLIKSKTTCGPSGNPHSASGKKGYELCDATLSNWIIDNKYFDYPTGKPTQLSFEWVDMDNDDGIVRLEFLSKTR